MSRVYLDYAAATPLLPEVLAAMMPYFTEKFGNPSSIHAEGVAAKKAIEEARTSVATLVGARTKDVVFTSGTTEGINAVLRTFAGGTIAVGAAEHSAVRESAAAWGGTIIDIPLAPDGRLDLQSFEQVLAMSPDLILFSHVNNQLGTKEDVMEVMRRVKHAARRPRVVIDCAQSVLTEDVDVERWEADYIVFGAGKIYGPKGVGALVARQGAPLSPIVHGGGQEGGKRSGTENVAGIIGFGEAAARAKADMMLRRDHFATLNNEAMRIIGSNDKLEIVSPRDAVPHVVTFAVPTHDAEEIVLRLDAAGVAVSAGSACQKAQGGEHVFRAIGRAELAGSAIRISFGLPTTIDDLAAFERALSEALAI